MRLIFAIIGFGIFSRSYGQGDTLLVSSTIKGLRELVKNTKGVTNYYIFEKACPRITSDPCDFEYYVLTSTSDSVNVELYNSCEKTLIEKGKIDMTQVNFFEKNKDIIKNEKFDFKKLPDHACYFKFYEINDDDILTFKYLKSTSESEKRNKKLKSYALINTLNNEIGQINALTMCIINGRALCKFVVLIFKERSVSWDSFTDLKPTTSHT